MWFGEKERKKKKNQREGEEEEEEEKDKWEGQWWEENGKSMDVERGKQNDDIERNAEEKVELISESPEFT